LLERSNLFTNADKLYFCGRIQSPLIYPAPTAPRPQVQPGCTGDYIYGYVDSGDVETYTNASSTSLIQVKNVYYYGTASVELDADCALSDDNKYLMASFSTNYHANRPAGTNDIWTDSSHVVK